MILSSNYLFSSLVSPHENKVMMPFGRIKDTVNLLVGKIVDINSSLSEDKHFDCNGPGYIPIKYNSI